MDLEARLMRLVDEAEVKRVQLRYCRGLDRMDWGLVRACFHPDAIHDLGPFKGTVEEFIPWVSALMPSFESTTHFGGSQTVEIDGDDAWAEQYVRAYHRTAATEDGPAVDWILIVGARASRSVPTLSSATLRSAQSGSAARVAPTTSPTSAQAARKNSGTLDLRAFVSQDMTQVI
jgi:hypothetical protein